MDRRRGQDGQIFQKGRTRTDNWNPELSAHLRYLMDIPGQEDRKLKCVTLGKFRTRTLAEQAAREYMVVNAVNSVGRQTEAIVSVTFREQADRYLTYMQSRTRKPVKPATIAGCRDAINAWLNPHLGDMQLADVGNAALKKLTAAMLDKKLSAKSMVNYIGVAKSIVASAVDNEGEQLFPRAWNHEFIGLPIVNRKIQRRPTATDAEVGDIIARATERYKMLYALLGGSGLRIGEALAIRAEAPSEKRTTISADCLTVHVRASVWRGQEQTPKTENAVRDVDLPPELTKMLKAFVVGQDFRKSTYLFQTSSGGPLSQRNILRDSLHLILQEMGRETSGFHVFRRFRAAWLRKNRCPWDLEKYWLGHADKNITDRYTVQLREDIEFRQDYAKRIGLGFSLNSQPSQPELKAVEKRKAA